MTSKSDQLEFKVNNPAGSLKYESDNKTLKEAVESFEKELIEHYLEMKGGSVYEVADVLGITPSGLYKKIRKYGILQEL